MEMRVVGKRFAVYRTINVTGTTPIYIYLINMNFYDQFVYNSTSEKK